MGSVVFKISASLVKPTRDTLLDYCSYCLVVIGLIGVARVWIGGAGLRNGCPLESFETPLVSNDTDKLSPTIIPRPTKRSSFAEPTTILLHGHHAIYQPFTGVLDTIDAKKHLELKRNVKPKSLYQHNIIGNQSNWTQQHEKCAKQYQSVFAYVLLIESAILLFIGLIWAKIPKVSCVINEFSKLIYSCEKSEWAKRALHLINEAGQVENMSQSFYSIVSSDSAVYDIKSLLDMIFHPDGDYKTKACARHLYEKVQIFCDIHTKRTAIWTTYILKSFLQFGFWIIIFNINLVLFVVLEFYIMCPEDSPIPCDHDVFLRIVWFMAQTVLLIYVVFICKTLRWINEKSIVHQWSCCNYFSCLGKHRTLYADEESASLSCRPYRFADNEPVYNDVAVLLHLLEEAHPKVLPYFVVFMFPEWKEKLTSFTNPVQTSDIRSAMQMLSGRPPPIIEITDISMSETEEQVGYEPTKSALAKKRSKNSVTFYIGNELCKTDDRRRKFCTEGVDTVSHDSTLHISSIPKSKGKSPQKISGQQTHVGGISVQSSRGKMPVEDAKETTFLLHKAGSSDSMGSSDQESNAAGTGSNPPCDFSENLPLL